FSYVPFWGSSVSDVPVTWIRRSVRRRPRSPKAAPPPRPPRPATIPRRASRPAPVTPPSASRRAAGRDSATRRSFSASSTARSSEIVALREPRLAASSVDRRHELGGPKGTPTAHHHARTGQVVDGGQRVGVEEHQIGELAGRDVAEVDL